MPGGLLPAVEFLYERGKRGSERKECRVPVLVRGQVGFKSPSVFITGAGKDGPSCTVSQIPLAQSPSSPQQSGALTVTVLPANSRGSGVSLRLPPAKVGAGDADLDRGHGHGALCGAAPREEVCAASSPSCGPVARHSGADSVPGKSPSPSLSAGGRSEAGARS